jgi:MFS family permease
MAALTFGLMGAAGLAVGVVALALDLTPVVLFWTILGGLLTGLVAVVVSGILGPRRSDRRAATGRRAARVGAVVGAVAFVASGALFAFAIYSDDQDIEDCVLGARTASAEQKCYEGDIIDFIDRNLVN